MKCEFWKPIKELSLFYFNKINWYSLYFEWIIYLCIICNNLHWNILVHWVALLLISFTIQNQKFITVVTITTGFIIKSVSNRKPSRIAWWVQVVQIPNLLENQVLTLATNTCHLFFLEMTGLFWSFLRNVCHILKFE